jgi:KDO2-lipid IV(A) lauroyltransferase
MLALVRFFSFIFCKLSPESSLFIGRMLGRLYYWLDSKHRRIAYQNMRLALANELDLKQLKAVLKQYYLNLAQNLVEILYMPRIDAAYIKRYIRFDGLQHLYEVGSKEKGVILTSAHFGNWEIPNIICKYLFPGRPYFVLAKEQARSAGLNHLLNSYRQMHGYSIISNTATGLRQAVENLKKGAFLGMVIDQGIGASSVVIDFCQHRVKAPIGALKLGLEFEAPIILTYLRRIKGPHLLLTILPAVALAKKGDKRAQIEAGAAQLNKSVEKFVKQYPADYLWQFKRFKNRLDRKILIVNDGKTGHLRQSQAVARILEGVLQRKGLEGKSAVLDIEFKSKAAKAVLAVFVKFFKLKLGFWPMRLIFPDNIYKKLIHICPDFVISAGSGPALINRIISKENQSKSIALMRPSFLAVKNFDLAIVARHDRINLKDNVLIVDGAPNLIDCTYLEQNTALLLNRFKIDTDPKRLNIGLLIGGNTKDFNLTKTKVESACRQILHLADETNAQILVSSSRRTTPEIEQILKDNFKHHGNCPLLVIANEANISEAVGAILGLCQIIIVSAESISMVSEAASCGKYIVVFGLTPQEKNTKRERFLSYLVRAGYIYRADSDLAGLIRSLWANKPSVKRLKTSDIIQSALERLA